MSQMIHYRDDLFLLSVGVKNLDAALSTEADPEFFGDRILEAILFIDTATKRIAEILAKNLHLVDRNEYLRLLERLSLDFARSLERIGSKRTPLASSLESHSPQIEGIIAGQRDLAQDLGEGIGGRENGDAADASIVSGDELAKLLGDEPR